jgi:hypothetical protein
MLTVTPTTTPTTMRTTGLLLPNSNMNMTTPMATDMNMDIPMAMDMNMDIPIPMNAMAFMNRATITATIMKGTTTKRMTMSTGTFRTYAR